MAHITLNSDLGESFGLHSFGNDDAIMDQVDLVNVACGGHAGDPEVMRETVEKAVGKGLKVGAHPGLPDLVGFGRREMKLFPAEVESLIVYQVGSVVAFLRREGAELSHIKPHGSLYGMLARDEELMAAAADAIAMFGVSMLGMAGTAHEKVCKEKGIEFIPELYVDLDYRGDGSLIIPRRPTGTDPERAAARVRRVLDEGVVEAEDGTLLSVTFASICVHSDIPGAGEVARAVREVLSGSDDTAAAASVGAAHGETQRATEAGPATTQDVGDQDASAGQESPSEPEKAGSSPTTAAPSGTAAPPDTAASEDNGGSQQAAESGGIEIVSPLPGTFYRCPAPGEPRFVEDGADVEAGQTIGLVEIMKQFSEVKATQAGRSITFAVDDEGAVNPGDVIATLQG